MLRPASEGTGVIAGGGVRAVLELGGIRDILAKSLGTTNPINMLKATINGLQSLRRPRRVAASRGLTISQVLPTKKVEEEVSDTEPVSDTVTPEPAATAAEAPEVSEETEWRRSRSGKFVLDQRSARHRGTLRALGLGKIGRTAEHSEGPELAGMLRKVRHLVHIEDGK